MGHSGPRAVSVRLNLYSNTFLLITWSLRRSVTRSYYRGAAGALLVYDITKYVNLVRGIPCALISFPVGSLSQICQDGLPMQEHSRVPN